jgi:hypothetical protein
MDPSSGGWKGGLSVRRFLVVVAIVALVFRSFSSMSMTRLGDLLLVTGLAETEQDAVWNDDTSTTRNTSTFVPSSSLKKNHSNASSFDSNATESSHHENTTATTTTTTTTTHPTLSACLLIKDDNDILNEWIAYHFHLWNLRHVVVAVDPTSKTSPQPLLEQWARVFSSNSSSSSSSNSSSSNTNTNTNNMIFQYTLWHDKDYMPERFVQGDYSQVKARLGKLPLKYPNRTFSDQEIQQISNHRFRQREFYKACLQHQQHHQYDYDYDYDDHYLVDHLQQQQQDQADQEASRTSNNSVQQQWIVHIDTDEYLSLNPWLLLESSRKNESSSSSSTTNTSSMVQERRSRVLAVKPTAGALLELLMDDRRRQQQGREDHPSSSSLSWCVGIPRLLFGGVVEGEEHGIAGPWASSTRTSSIASTRKDASWNVTLLESIRWKYHAPMVTAGPLNGQPKALLDWQVLRSSSNKQQQRQRNTLLRNIHSIHQPHKDACPKSVSMDGSLSKEESSRPPLLAIYHYLGSLERYLSREDPRRTREVRTNEWMDGSVVAGRPMNHES